jgi:hypothetical protein
VATTTGAEFGYGFTVPDDLFDHWFLGRGETAGTLAAVEPEPEAEVFLEPLGPEVPLEEELPVTSEVPEVPELGAPEVPKVPEAAVPAKRKRGVKAAEGEV